MRRRAMFSTLLQPKPVEKYIQFEDKAVEAICVANWSSDGIGLTMEDAAKVATIGTTFRGNKEITSFNEFRYFTGVTFLSTTTSINTGAFEGCSALESICLPSSVTTIGDYSFSQCSELKVVGGMDNVATIMRYAFNESGMEELNLPSCTIMRTSIAPNSQIKRIIAPSLQKILGSLIKVYNLELLDVGAELNEIEAYSFWQMTTNKTTFICRATTPPSMGSNNNMTFCSAIYVPDASLEAYKTATNWNTYADRIHPLSEIEGGHITTFEGLIGAYTFEGRSNEDADRDIVEDKSGYNNTLTLKSMQWGFIHNTLPDLMREGFWDDALWLSQSGYGEITLPNGLTDFTVIAKRFVFNANAGGRWASLVGTGKSSGKGLFWLEYVADNGQYTNQVKGLKYTLPSLESEITWLTNTHYNGHRLTGTQGNDVHDGMVYINKFRGDVNSVRYQKIYAIYLFNRQLSPSEIEAFIKEKIDDSYVLPTIEQ